MLTFWRNGFSLDDGPLRSFEDPDNAAFLANIRQGRVPPELKAQFGQAVNLAVADKSGEDYVPPPKKLKPFGGQGNRLGSVDPDAPASVVAAALTPAPAPAAAPAAASSSSASSSAPASSVVDESAPTTTIQIRLADGTRYARALGHLRVGAS